MNGSDLEGGSRGESPEEAYPSELDNLDEAGKEKALTGIFPALKPFDIIWTLKKCKWDTGLAIDELMTQAFLEESGSRHHGIEAFSESEIVPRQRKGKGKKKKRVAVNASNSTSPAIPPEELPLESKWDLGKHDIEFLSTRTGFPAQQITSIYHKHGGSVRASIAAIVAAHDLVMVAGDIHDPRAAPRLAEQFQHHRIVRLGPIPGALQPPAIDDVADQIHGLGIVVLEEVEELFGLGAMRAEMEIREEQRPVTGGSRRH